MLKYALITNKKTGACMVGLGTNIKYYKKIGMTELDVTKSEVDGIWYLTEKLQTEEYINALNEKIKAEKTETLKKELEELDRKRIRALCEPELKNTDEGITWLEYYNNQAIKIRSELKNLTT